MINSTSPQVPLSVSNALGVCGLQISSTTAVSTVLQQQADDGVWITANDGIESIRISGLDFFNKFGRSGYDLSLYENNNITYYNCLPAGPFVTNTSRWTVYNPTNQQQQFQHWNGSSWVTGSFI